MYVTYIYIHKYNFNEFVTIQFLVNSAGHGLSLPGRWTN